MVTKPATHDSHAFAFNKSTGAALLALADAREAVRRFPDEWSFDPWGPPQDRGQFIHIPSDVAELPRRRVARSPDGSGAISSTRRRTRSTPPWPAGTRSASTPRRRSTWRACNDR
jgi:hypothetical protein